MEINRIQVFLGESGEEQETAQAESWMTKSDPAFRANAVSVLSIIHSQRSINDLRLLTTDKVPDVSLPAKHALEEASAQ